MEEIRGVLERVTFHNSDNGYVVARVRPTDGKEAITFVGTLHSPLIGEELKFKGAGSSIRSLAGNSNFLLVSEFYRLQLMGLFVFFRLGRFVG
jgi:hypothetical protein